MTIRLLISTYDEKDPQRAEELSYCLGENQKIFDEVITVPDGERKVTFDDLFNKANEITGSLDINVIANSDILFDETILEIPAMDPKQCLAITRDDIPNEQIARASQDVWVFEGFIKGVNGDFRIGVPGCDNRIAEEIHQAGYEVINPCKSINCKHIHKGDPWYEGQAAEHKIPRPYRFVAPCEL